MNDDYEVVWDGRGPLPGIGVITRHEHYLTTAAMEQNATARGGVPTAKEMRGKTELTGLQVRESRPRPDGGINLCECGRAVPAAEWRNRLRRCPACRAKQREVKPISVQPKPARGRCVTCESWTGACVKCQVRAKKNASKKKRCACGEKLTALDWRAGVRDCRSCAIHGAKVA